MSKWAIAKAGVGIIVSVGIGGIITNAVNATTPGNIGIIRKITIGAGTFVLSQMVGDKIVQYTDVKMEAAYAAVKKIIKDVNEGK